MKINTKVRISTILWTVACFILNFYLFSRGSVGGLIVSGSTMQILCFFSVGLCAIVFYRGIDLKKMPKLLSLYMFAIMVIIIFSWNNWDLKNDKFYFFYIVAILFFFFAINTDKWAKRMIIAGIVIGLFYAFWTWVCSLDGNFYLSVIYPLFQNANGEALLRTYDSGAVAGLTSHYSYNGQYLSYGLGIIVCYFCFNGGKKIKKMGWVMIAFVGGALLLSGKRGPVIWFAVSILLIYYFYNANKPTSRLFKIIAIIIIAIIGIYFAAQFVPSLTVVIERTLSSGDSIDDLTSGRTILWAQAIEGIKQSPIFGNGWGWFRYHNSYGTTYHAHNIYLQLICEVGIVGSIPFFVFFAITTIHPIMILKRARQGKIYMTNSQIMWLCCALYVELFFIFYGLDGSNLYDVQCYGPYFMYCALSEYYWLQMKRGILDTPSPEVKAY